MSAVLAVGLAGVSGVVAVLGSWDALAAVEAVRLPRAAGALLARAGRDGHEPSRLERRRLGLLVAGTLLMGGWLVAGPLVGLGLAAAGPWLAVVLVRRRRGRYLDELARGAPVVARALADALSAGASVRGSVAAAASGVEGAAGRELRAAAGALAIGESTELVLDGLRRRAGCRPFDTIAAAVLIQRDAGGDLAALLRGIAGAQEEAARLEHDARASTAQARFTGTLVCTLPLLAAGLAELASPGYLRTLLSAPLSALLAAAALAFQVAALLAIRRLARVRA